MPFLYLYYIYTYTHTRIYLSRETLTDIQIETYYTMQSCVSVKLDLFTLTPTPCRSNIQSQ